MRAKPKLSFRYDGDDDDDGNNNNNNNNVYTKWKCQLSVKFSA